MQQENAGLPEAQQREENLNKLLTKVEKLGYAETKSPLKEAFEQGLAEFTIHTSKTFGEKVMDVGLNFGEGKNRDGRIYLNEQEALLVRPVNVPHDTINGRNTEAIEALILHLPKNEQGFVDAKAFTPQDEAIVLEMQAAIQWAMENAPQVFNALMVKYQPEINFAVPKSMGEQQDKLINDMTRYNKVSSYFNLTALETFNAMESRFPLKTLFRTKDTPGQPVSPADAQDMSKRQFQAYVKFDFSKRNNDGTCPVELIPANRLQIGKGLLEYNWEEMQSRQNRGNIIHYLEKGSAFQLTNANKTGEKHVLVSANPEYGTFDLRKTSGAIIYNQKDYLRNPLVIEVGAVISLKKDTGEERAKSVDVPPSLPVDAVADRMKEARENAMKKGQQQEEGEGQKRASLNNSPHYSGEKNKGDENTGIKPPATQSIGKEADAKDKKNAQTLRTIKRARTVGGQGGGLKI